jgi:hypothetical protein
MRHPPPTKLEWADGDPDGQHAEPVDWRPRLALTLLLSLFMLTPLLGGCQTGATPLLTAIYHETAIKGEVTIGSLMVGGLPLTFPCRAWGEGKVVMQYPALPHLDFIGEGGILIEPIQPRDAEGIRAQIAAGKIRGATLVEFGSFASYRARGRPVEAP